ncbi:MAG: pirin family protein [Cytophagaceae bacterium]
MKKLIYKASERGFADHGWLKAAHFFSFAGYYDPSKMHFGMLRVLNDDKVGPGAGFGMHPHDNMEIVTIPTHGALEHKDTMGNSTVIKTSDVQIMSAGTGVRHSEFNPSKEESVNLFQIWVFPKVKNIQPRYEQKTFNATERINRWQLIVSPDSSEGAVWINQDAWFFLADPEKGSELIYETKKTGNGSFLLVIEGRIEVEGVELGARDAIGIYDVDKFSLSALDDSKVLLIDIPMN